MAKVLQLRRGDSSTLDAITGAEGEIFVDLDTYTLRVHDGSTAGGHIIGDVDFYADQASFPATGLDNKIYLAEDTGLLYRWDGTAYEQVGGGAVEWGAIGGTLSNQTDLQNALNAKQATLVSGTNIKTVNGNTILGSGNIDLSTSLTLSGTNLQYTNIDGTVQTVSLAGFLDDTTNTVSSAVLNGNTITFTREDATTFTLNVSALYDDTNLVTSVNGSTGAVTVQPTLVSGTNIKTVDGQSIVGSGGITISNKNITLSGDVSGSGTTSINVQLNANVVGANELNVSGNGTSGQILTSVGNGSFSWSNPAASSAPPLGDLTDVVITSPTTGQALVYNGTNWINGSGAGGSVDLSEVAEDILPLFDGVFDIGSTEKRWYDVFVENSVDLGGITITSSPEVGAITINGDLVTGSLLVDNLLLSENLITPDDSTAREYLGDKGILVVDGNLDVQGDWAKIPVVETVGTIPPITTGEEGQIRYNKDNSSPEIYQESWNKIVAESSDGDINISGSYLVNGAPLDFGPISEGTGTGSVVAYPSVNTASGASSTIGGGSSNCATIDFSIIGGGYGNSASGHSSTVGGGYLNYATGATSTVGGGYSGCATGISSTIGGGSSNCATGVGSTIGGGYFNCATACHSTIGGGCFNCATACHSTVGGGHFNCASGSCSTIGGGCSNSVSGNFSTVGGGYLSNATGAFSIVGGGYSNKVTAVYSTVGGGYSNCATGSYSTIGGGFFGCTTQYGQRAYASGRFSATGDAQQVDYVARTKTTNSTPTNVWLNGSSERLYVTTNRTLFATVNVAGIKSDGSAAAHYIRKVAVKNIAGTVSLIGSVSTVGTDVEDNASYNVTITADNTYKALDIKVTGADTETLRWVTHVQGVEIVPGT